MRCLVNLKSRYFHGAAQFSGWCYILDYPMLLKRKTKPIANENFKSPKQDNSSTGC